MEDNIIGTHPLLETEKIIICEIRNIEYKRLIVR